MRFISIISALALGALVAACAGAVELPQSQPRGVFAETHGSAIAPPARAATVPASVAPPEGVGPGGLDFGQWRSADPEAYAQRFAAEVAAKTEGLSAEEAADFVHRNGFRCDASGRNIDCRLEIMDEACARDWYVVFPQGAMPPVAGADVMCLGALPPPE